MQKISAGRRFKIENGILVVEATVREISDDEYLAIAEANYRQGLANAQDVLAKHIPKAFGLVHPLMGPIGLFYGDKKRGLCHLMEERREAHNRTPSQNPPAEDALAQIIHAAIFGAPVLDMHTFARSTVGLNLVENNIQVVVAPMWRNPQDGKINLPVDKNSAWLLTGYQMEAPRQAAMSAWLQKPEASPAILAPKG